MGSLIRETTKKEEKNKKKKLNGLDSYIIFSFTCIILYTISAYVVVIKTGQSLDVLTSLFFGVFGGEILLCALIKKLKLRSIKKDLDENGGSVG